MRRSSGILLHPTSLPGPYGIGELGPAAYRFADWLAASGMLIWQVLPLGPTGYGESPYQLFSAFAGNPLLLSLEVLRDRGCLTAADLEDAPTFPAGRVDFERLIPWKWEVLRKAFRCSREAEREAAPPWLDEFARFMAMKRANGGVEWTKWDTRLEPDAEEVDFHRYLQLEFFRQWRALKEYCGRLGIAVMGDLPIYVAGDSADVWAHPELFRDDAVAGVPPDYFSATGQLWGNPLYQWDRMEADGYRWWIDRMSAALDLFDMVRIDHFRGFEAFWEVPAGARTAINGRWVKGPGSRLFRTLEATLGKMPVVAENLGVITPEVEAIREEFGYPGMAILQFAFGNDPQAPTFRPHNYVRNLVAYTGTHDNDTTLGWWRSTGGDSTRTAEDIENEKSAARRYVASDGDDITWLMIRALMASVADVVLFPMQDILGLGSEARMNTPSVPDGNWRWRMSGDPAPYTGRLREMVEAYER